MNKFMKAMTSLLTTVILVGGLSVGTLFAATADPNEPNDTIGKATSMTLGKTYDGEIGNYNKYSKSGKTDEDWFKIKVKKGVYKVTMTNYCKTFKDTTLIVSAGSKSDFDDSEFGALSLRDSFRKLNDVDYIQVSAEGTLYIKIWNYTDWKHTGKNFTYKLKIEEASYAVVQNGTTVKANVVCGRELLLAANFNNPTWKSSNTSIATVDELGRVKGKQAGSVTITATYGSYTAKAKVQVLYKDVTKSSDFWYEPTYYLTNKNVVKGYDKQTKFKPANDCSRAQMITFLWRLNGSPKPSSSKNPFNDIKKDDYFYNAVRWAAEKGIVTVPSNNKFNPQTVCNRAMTVTFLYRMAGSPSVDTSKNPFSDIQKSDYYFKAVIWASKKKIVAGYDDGTFRPDGKCLRRQMVTFLYKYDKYVNGKG